MATETPSAGDTIKVFYADEWHDLIVRTRQNGLDAHVLAELTFRTIGTWLAVWRAYKSDTWLLEGRVSAEEAMKVSNPKTSSEPFVTVFNKNYDKLSVTVHSHENGQAALDSVGALFYARDMLAKNMPQLLQVPEKPSVPPPAKDISDVDSFLDNEPKAPTTQPLPNAQGTVLHQGNVWTRAAIAGSLPDTIKIAQGSKDKPTQVMALLATEPYDYKVIKYQNKDIVLYDITGAITIKRDSKNNKQFIDVPTQGGKSIRFYERGETITKEGKVIKSDWQNMTKHLGLEGVQIPDNYQAAQPPTNDGAYIALKFGAVTTKDDGTKEQFKNYHGLFQLEGDLPKRSVQQSTQTTATQETDEYKDIPF